MKDILYSQIKKEKIKTLKTRDKKKRLGILHTGTFFDLTKEVQRIKQEEAAKFEEKARKEIMKRGEKLTHNTTNEVTHIILSLRDIEKINLGGKNARRKRRKS